MSCRGRPAAEYVRIYGPIASPSDTICSFFFLYNEIQTTNTSPEEKNNRLQPHHISKPCARTTNITNSLPRENTDNTTLATMLHLWNYWPFGYRFGPKSIKWHFVNNGIATTI